MGKIVVGIDEAGRGPLAGRVYAACVILNKDKEIIGLNDSKKLDHNTRLILYEEILKKSICCGIAYADPEEIDRLNILQATFLAMERALLKLNYNFDYVLIDGNIFPFKNKYKGEAIVKGDTKIPEIMAASILAKVERDLYMLEMDRQFPEYNFRKHKGYPTKEHIELIKKFGVSPIHRKTFKGVY